MHFYATGITPAMSVENVGKGSQYAIAYLDKDGKALDGSKTYKIHLPKNVPAKDFWSFTLYDNQTRSMLQTDERFPGLSSVDKSPPVANEDGSYDIYFGPEAPEGKESNWIQTVSGKGWNTICASMVHWGPSTIRLGSREIPSWLSRSVTERLIRSANIEPRVL